MIDMSTLDIVAVLFFLAAWIGYATLIGRLAGTGRSLSSAMDVQRKRWMQVMARRDLRMIDTAIMSGLQNGTAFFASTSLLAIGSAFALLNATDRIFGVLNDLSMQSSVPRGLFELKAIGLILIFGYAFFQFGWSYRLFNYASILVGATPSAVHAGEEEAVAAADRAAQFIIIAGRHFNHGLRAFFFAIGYLGWFINGWVFMLATATIFSVQAYRQFLSPAARAVIKAAREVKS
ncbi:DUF599 domain-containing protein [Kaistia algarum]|uniref:DUF599 domain-containing protein n=1 Tax=Kaistia algarum TaxID=2083279 RepID=UPI000CE8CB7E|nr:DUF599 family protein [Kaistia algarum]MCX5515252.1 DUF599 family protein [Kaistia algarum]PPE79960.1 DUF599 domain-containing protein [Kaistia algarum]